MLSYYLELLFVLRHSHDAMANAIRNIFFQVTLHFFSHCKWFTTFSISINVHSIRTRGLAAGVAAAINYIMCFASTKTYYNLETSLSMPGIAMFYCVCATLGLILMFNIMPETEGRSLEDIELHFLDDGKKITDWYIPQRNEVENNKTQEQIK